MLLVNLAQSCMATLLTSSYAMLNSRDYVVNEIHGKQANLVDCTGGQAKCAVHVSYQVFPKPPILCLHALLGGSKNTGVSGTAWSL